MAGFGRQGPNVSPEVVTRSSRCQQIVQALLRKKTPIAVDAEGVRLGPQGPLTLLQVGTYDGQVYLFDVHENHDLFTKGNLKDLLQAEDVVKVIHSCSGDSGALYVQFGVRLQNVFDTQVAHVLIEEYVNGVDFPHRLKLDLLTEQYGGPPNAAKKLKEEWKFIKDYWAKRPLTKEMLEYAAGDVTSLIPEVYQNQKRIVDQRRLWTVFQQRVEEEILVCIEPEAVNDAKSKRRQEKLSRILGELESKYAPRVPSVTQLSENQMEALKFIRQTDDLYQQSSFVKALSRTRLLYDLDNWQTALQKDKNKFKLERGQTRHLSKMCKHEDMAIRTKACHLQEAIDNDKIDKIIWKRKKNYTFATHEKFLVMGLPEERLSRQLRDVRQDLARELENEITSNLASVRGLDAQKAKLSKTQKQLLLATPDNLIRGPELKRLKREIEAHKQKDEQTDD